VELFEMDVTKDSEEQLVQKLQGVDIIVSVVAAEALETQRPLFRAAKKAGVKRVVPSDFATPAPEGVMLLHDTFSVYSHITFTFCPDMRGRKRQYTGTSRS
jgi:hypothetical protein